MRYQAHATCLSWIPPAAVEGVFSLPFGMGVAHYDQPPYRQHRLPEGALLCALPITSTEVPLLLDGLLRIEIDRQPALEVGPGAIFDAAQRTPFSKQHAAVRAVTPCRLAVLPRDQLDCPALLGVAAEQSARLEAHLRGRRPLQESS